VLLARVSAPGQFAPSRQGVG